MLIRTHRFHSRGSLRAVYQKGQSVRGSLLSLKYTDRDPKRPYRVAVVVSRKVSKSAVVRNRIRRRVYEIIRLHETYLPSGRDVIVTVFSDQVATMEAAKLNQLVAELLQKASNRSINS